MSTSTTARPRRTARNLLLWCAALVLGSALLVALGPRAQEDTYLDPDGHGQNGIAALVEVLRSQDITVTPVTSIDALRLARERAGSGPVTVAVGPTTFLTTGGAGSMIDTLAASDRLVLLDGGAPVLAELVSDLTVLPVGGEGEILPSCREQVTRHGADDAIIESVDLRFVTEGAISGMATCYPLDTGTGPPAGSALVVLAPEQGRPLTYALGFGRGLTNARITDASHAALGLRLLGAHPQLIVYTPSLADALGTSGEPEQTVEPPRWLMPGVALLAVAVLAYAVAAGRRLGRLVPEPLPVVVKASETTLSRAELYRAARDRSRAAAALRAGTLARLRPRLRLEPRAETQAVLTALASHGIPESAAAPLLTGPDPTDDAGLVRLARDLTTLEDKVNPR